MLFGPLIKLNRFLYLCNVRLHLFLCEWSEKALGLDYKVRKSKLAPDFLEKLRTAINDDPKKQLMKKIMRENKVQPDLEFQVRILEPE